MNELPSNLQELELSLNFNDLGINEDNIKFLGEGIKEL